jgi:DNA uptake protein ComE-like DNA-binding protein
MNLRGTVPQIPTSRAAPAARRAGRASVLVIVLWIAFGLVGLSLYFANSMNFELRASDNRVSGLASEEAIEGAIRYLTFVLNTQIAYGSNGYVPAPFWNYQCEAVPVGESYYWLVGRDTNNPVGPGRMAFALIPENSKLNLNTASSNTLYWLPRMGDELIQAVLDWRDTNGSGATVSYYSSLIPPYACKCDRFETVDELRLLYGATMDVCVGEDINRNGILDPNENDENSDGVCTPGLLEYLTVYSRDLMPASTNLDGSSNIVINISSMSSSSQLQALLYTNNFDSTTVSRILTSLGFTTSASGSTTTTTVTSRGLLDFYVKSGMTAEEFALIVTNLATTANPYVEGRINVNYASAQVLACFLNGDLAAAQSLVEYRNANPNSLGSVAWVADALLQSNPDYLTLLRNGDYLTTQSWQYTADIVALGPHNRGYRRVKVVFDTSNGVAQIIHRQDLTHLGWALGLNVRQNWFLAQGNQ